MGLDRRREGVGASRQEERHRSSRPSESGGNEGDGDRPRKRTKWDEKGPVGPVGPVPKPSPLPTGTLPGVHFRPAIRTKVLTLPAAQKGALIGKGGESISAIRAASGAEINIKHLEGELLLSVTISGSNVELAEKLIGERLTTSGRSTDGGWESKLISVPQELIGPTIGNGGCNLREMQESTGCKIKFIQANEVDPTAEAGRQVACVRGPPDKIAAGEQALLEKVTQVQQIQANRRMGKGYASFADGCGMGGPMAFRGCHPDGMGGGASGGISGAAAGMNLGAEEKGGGAGELYDVDGMADPATGMPVKGAYGMGKAGKPMCLKGMCGKGMCGMAGKGMGGAKGFDMAAANWEGAEMTGMSWDGTDGNGAAWDGMGVADMGWEGKGNWCAPAMWNTWWWGGWRGGGKKKPPIPCKFQMRGYCKNGESCTFSHNPEVIAAALGEGYTANMESLWDPGYKMQYCKYWESGKCTRGATCSFAHGIDELRGGLTLENLSLMEEAQRTMPSSIQPEEVEQRLRAMDGAEPPLTGAIDGSGGPQPA